MFHIAIEVAVALGFGFWVYKNQVEFKTLVTKVDNLAKSGVAAVEAEAKTVISKL